MRPARAGYPTARLEEAPGRGGLFQEWESITTSGDPMATLRLCCPVCGAALFRASKRLSCSRCGREFPVRAGVPSFAPPVCVADAPARRRFGALVKDINARGWEEAVHRRLPRAALEQYRHLFLPLRADWFYLGQVAHRGRAVDLSEDGGGVTLRLAGLFREVIAVDRVSERAGFVHRLCASEGCANVRTLHADWRGLPLPSEQADLVVLNEGLEWAARGGGEPDPERAQHDLLARLFGLLVPGGSLCLGVQNRFTPAYLLGARDHARCRWAGVMPRGLHRRWGRPKPDSEAPPLTHSAAGYRRLLEAAGFADVLVYAAFPSHRYPRLLVPLADGARLGWAVELSLARRARRLRPLTRLLYRALAHPTVARLICSLSGSLIVWARRPAGAPASRESLLQHVTAKVRTEWSALGLRGEPPSALSVTQLAGNWDQGGKVNWFFFPPHTSHPALVARVARTPDVATRLRHEHDMLCWLRQLSPTLSARVPRPLAAWVVEGHPVMLQESVALTPLRRRLAEESAEAGLLRTLRLSQPFLVELAQLTRRDRPGGPSERLEDTLARAQSMAGDPHYPETTRALLRELIELAHAARTLSFTVTHHGDLNAADVLGETADFRILDWEWAVREGLPFVDLFGLGVTAAEVHGPEAVAVAVRALIGAPTDEGALRPEVQAWTTSYCARLGLSESLRAPLAAAGLLTALVRTPHSRLSHQMLLRPNESALFMEASRALVQAVRPETLSSLQDLAA